MAKLPQLSKAFMHLNTEIISMKLLSSLQPSLVQLRYLDECR